MAKRTTLLSRIARVWPYFSGSRAGWALAIGATIAASATEPFIPALLKPLLDRGFQKDSFSLWLVPIALMLLFTLRGLSGFLAQFALAKVTNDGLLKLRKAMFGKLLSARLTLFADQSSSAIANTVVYEVFNSSSLLINAVMKLARDMLTLLALIGYLVYLNWKLTLIVALTIIALAVMYELPRQNKWIAVVAVAGVMALTFASSKNFRDRMLSVSSEVAAYSEHTVSETSSGVRLYYWQVSLLAAMEKPVLGHGAGSWNKEYRRLGADKANPLTLSINDPHQLFLLWAVEGGLVGLSLLGAIFIYVLICSRALALQEAHMLQTIVAALIISGMFNSMIFGIGMGDFFCIAIGILLGMHGDKITESKRETI